MATGFSFFVLFSFTLKSYLRSKQGTVLNSFGVSGFLIKIIFGYLISVSPPSVLNLGLTSLRDNYELELELELGVLIS